MVDVGQGLAGGMGDSQVIYGKLAHVLHAQLPCYQL